MKTSIATRRFTLREYCLADGTQFVAYQTDPAFALFHGADEVGDANARNVFQLFLDWQGVVPRLNYQLAIVMRDDDTKLIGSCGVRMAGCMPGEAVFGIELARPYWGRYRFAQEVSEAMIDWGFSSLKLSALIADTAFDNVAVSRMADAAGFVRTHAEGKQWWRLERSAWERY